jgi:hypothetical protein
MEAQDGNTSDKRSFQDRVRRVKLFMETIENAPNDLYFIVDAAFYTPGKLAELDAVSCSLNVWTPTPRQRDLGVSARAGLAVWLSVLTLLNSPPRSD